MTQVETMRIIADAMEGKCKIELLFESRYIYLGFDTENFLGERQVWKKIRWEEKEGKWYIGDGRCASISLWEIIYKKMEIRIAKSLPLLSDVDADFAEKYLPHDWWIARDKNNLLCIYEEKPNRLSSFWTYEGEKQVYSLGYLPTFPRFTEVKWENDDCYTIQELLDYYRSNKGDSK